LLVAYRLEQQGWEVNERVIIDGADSMGELFCCPSEKNEYRQVTLFILLVCYWAKSALNDRTTFLLDEVRRICHNFSAIYSEWLGSNPKMTVSPVLMNRLYSLLRTHSEPQYHFIVDQIVQLSHAYSSEREEEGKRRFAFRERESSSLSSSE
jgi:hypothetical protein